MPKLRFSMRGMMIAVATLAVVFLGIREYRIRAWAAWVESLNPYPVAITKLSVTPINHGYTVPGRPLPVEIDCDFKLTGAKLPKGTNILVWIAVAIQDEKSKTDVDGHSLFIPLKVGERESASDKFTYVAIVPRPGLFYLRHELSSQTLTGGWQSSGGGSMPIHCVASPADKDQATRHQGVK